jgi:hypothetical protein
MSNKDVRAENPLRDLFANDYWGTPMIAADSHKSYRPLTVLTFRANYLLHGFDAAGFHLVNVVVHAAVCMLFVKLADLTFQLEDKRVRDYAPLVCGLLFAVHPVHCDAIANLVGRADSLCAMFYLLALFAYTSAAKHASTNTFMIIVTVFLVVCSLLCKETGITAFGIIAAYDFLIVNKGARFLKCITTARASPKARAQRICWPIFGRRFFVLVLFGALIMVLRLSLHGTEQFLYQWTFLENHISLLPHGVPKVLSIAYTHSRYALLLVWPSNLCYDYGYNAIPVVYSFLDNRNVSTLLAYAALGCWLGVGIAQGSSALLFSLACFVLPFSISAQVALSVGTVVAERLLYIPSMGYCLLLGHLLVLLYHRLYHRLATALKPTMLRSSACLFASMPVALLVCYWAAYSIQRNSEFRTERALFEAGVRAQPQSVKVLNNLAKELLNSEPLRAAGYLRTSLSLMPSYTVL